MLFDVNQDLLASGVVILSGGTDNYGVPVVTFPGQGTPSLPRYDLREVGQLVSVYLGMCGGTASFLVDLQHGATLDTMNRLAGSLEYLEIQRRGSVRTVYVIKPKSRAKLRFLKKCISSHKENGSHFTVVLLKNQRDLFYYIHSSNLTWDFGGTLQYNHEAWVIFQKVVWEAVEGARTVLKTFPDVRDKISLLQEFDTMDLEAADINNLIDDIQLKYKTVVGNSGVHEAMDQVKQTIHKFEKPDEDTNLSQIHATLVTDAIGKLRRSHSELSAVLNELESLKDKIDSELKSEAKFRNCVERAIKIQTRIQSEFWPQLVHHPYVGNTVSQAEIYRTHFTAWLFQPAKEMLSDATQLLVDMKNVISADLGKQNKTVEVAAKLSEAVQPLARQLNRLNDTYMNIHVFHIVFEKCKSWYSKTLRSISSDFGIENKAQSWKQLVLTHAKKHSPPRSDHIVILNEHLPTILDNILKEEAKLLCHRVKILLQLLKKDLINDKELSQVRAWEEDQMFLKVDDSNEVLYSREDLSQLQIDSDNVLSQRVSPIYQQIPPNHEYTEYDEYNMLPEKELPVSDNDLIRYFQEHETRNESINYDSLGDASCGSIEMRRQTHDQHTDRDSSGESSNHFMARRRVRRRKVAQSKINSLPRSLSSSDIGSHDDERFIDLSHSAVDEHASGNKTFINSDYFPEKQSGILDSVDAFLSNRESSSNLQSKHTGNINVTLTKEDDPNTPMSNLQLKEKLAPQAEERESLRCLPNSTEGPYVLELSDAYEDDTCPSVTDLLKQNLSGSFNYDPNVLGVESYIKQHEIINTTENTCTLTQVDASAALGHYMAGDSREALNSSRLNRESFSPQSMSESEIISVGGLSGESLLKSNEWNNVEFRSLKPSGSVPLEHKRDLREHRNRDDQNPINNSNTNVNFGRSSWKLNPISLQENVRPDISKPDQTNACHLMYSAGSTRSDIFTSPLRSESSHVPYTYKTDGVFSETRNAHIHVSHDEHFTDSKLSRVNETKPSSYKRVDEKKNENVDFALLVRKLRKKLSKSLYDLNDDGSYANYHLGYRLSQSLFTMNALGESILAKGKGTSHRTYTNFEEEIPFDQEYDEMSECRSPSFPKHANGQPWFTGSRTNSSFHNWSRANNEGIIAFYESGTHEFRDTAENSTIRERSGQHSLQNEERIPDRGKTDDKNDHVEEDIAQKLEMLRLRMSFSRPKKYESIRKSRHNLPSANHHC